ncbi:MAG: OmpH family outer membrane protein [Planctomycetaceae bacterium]|nr:OmpH family outer membrane protein [Planctomycetaceae bacterium]
MNRLILSLAACVTVATLAFAQAPSTPPKPAVPHKVGLIDMAHIFKNYEKFTALTESLQKEIEASDNQAKQMLEALQAKQKLLTGGTLVEGSPDFAKHEAELLDMQTNLETFRRKSQRDFLRKEADVYKTVYLEVEDAVKRYAEYYQYTLVLRFNRQNVDSAENPRDIISGMNRQVVFHRADEDITDPILSHLNGEWSKRRAASAR